MFLTYLLIAVLSATAGFAIGFTIGYFMELNDMKRNIQNNDTNGADKAKVEKVIGGYLATAKTVNVGLFKGSDRVGDVTIECPQGTNVKQGDYVYL